MFLVKNPKTGNFLHLHQAMAVTQSVSQADNIIAVYSSGDIYIIHMSIKTYEEYVLGGSTLVEAHWHNESKHTT